MGQVIPFPGTDPVERVRRIRTACKTIYKHSYLRSGGSAGLFFPDMDNPAAAAAIETMVNTYVLTKTPLVWIEEEASRLKEGSYCA